MITIQAAMLIVLGFSMAGLLACLLAPMYRRRVARLVTDALKRSMPMTAAEISADKDRLRAEYAIKIHKLETKVDEAALASARQMIEINRRDAAISELEGETGRLKSAIEEHENARRVLEQTITERLPKVEFRLSEAKKLLFQRDREITSLTQSANRQAQALEEASQINTQQRDEIHRLSATLTTRAARNREPIADPRFDGEVVLRAEIEALRAKARDQSQLISRLQGVVIQSGARPDMIAGMTSAGMAEGSGPDAEIARLRSALAEAEQTLRSVQGAAESEHATHTAIEGDIRAMKSQTQDQNAEIARLKASLQSYEQSVTDDRAASESKITLKARVSSYQAQVDEQSNTIQLLRSELAAANEKLARQAAHFMDEMRRLGSGTRPASGSPNSAAPSGQGLDFMRRSLSERINEPRPAKESSDAAVSSVLLAEASAAKQDTSHVPGFIRSRDIAAVTADKAPSNGSGASEEGLKAANGNNATNKVAAVPGRRPGLLARITGGEKQKA